MEKKNNNGIVITLVLIIIILLVVIGLMFTGIISLNNNVNNITTQEEDNNVEEEETKYTYSSVKGLYKYTANTSEEDGFVPITYLYLYENGTYIYMMPVRTPYGYMGNYTIDGNKISLNSEFSIGGSSLFLKNITSLLYIDSNIITDNNPIGTFDNESSINLEKANTNDENEFLKNYDYNNILNNWTIEQ